MNEHNKINQVRQSSHIGKVFLILANIIIFVIALLIAPNLAPLLFFGFIISLIAIYFMIPKSQPIKNLVTNTKQINSAISRQGFPVVEALQFPAYIIDKNGTVVFSNKPSVLAFGKIKSGDKVFILFRQPELRRLIEKALKSNTPYKGEYNEPIPGDRWFGVEVTAIRDIQKTNADQLYILAFHDLTEAKRTDQMRSDFIANASHELRTPLASLSGYIETIKGPARKDEKAIDRFTDVMLDQAQRMTRLVNDLLSLSRIEMQSHVRPSEAVNLTEVISKVVNSLESVADRLNVKIQFDRSKEIYTLGDRDELLQVFENLIENACKYGEDGKRVEVSLSVNHDENEILASVQDFGPGIALEHQQRITERFYRVDVVRSREKQGTGLGLAIVKHILNRHATKLGIESKPDQGARFFVKFPLLKITKSNAVEEQ